MEESIFGGSFNSLLIIVFVGIFIYSIISKVRKKNKIIKLKSGEIQSKEIKGVVSEIKYTAGGKNNSGKITSRYFIAKGTNPITNEEMEFESDYFPYQDSWLKIRWMGPNQEDINKLLEYARTFIKEGDTVKIYISNENPELYYIDDVVRNYREINDDVIQIVDDLNGFSKNLNIVGLKANSGLVNMFKKVRIFGVVIVLVFVGLQFFISWIVNDDGPKLNMPKFDGGMNLNFGGNYMVRIILVLLIAFIIYKVIRDYRGDKK